LIPESLDLALKLTQSRVGTTGSRLGVRELQSQAFDGDLQRAPL